jgi:hypothetical protein
MIGKTMPTIQTPSKLSPSVRRNSGFSLYLPSRRKRIDLLLRLLLEKASEAGFFQQQKTFSSNYSES